MIQPWDSKLANLHLAFQFLLFSPIYSCFISNVGVFFGAFLGPILLVLAFNMVIFIIVIVVLVRHLCKRSKEHNKKAGNLKLMANITGVAFLFGLTWLFGALTVVNADQAFQILFTLVNSFQGFLIFIFFCVLNSDVRLAWAQKILGKRLAPQTSTGTTSVVTKQTIPYQTRQDAYKQSDSIATEDISYVDFDEGVRPVGLEGQPSESEVQGSVVIEEVGTLGLVARLIRTLTQKREHMVEVVTVKFEEGEDIELNIKEASKSPENEL